MPDSDKQPILGKLFGGWKNYVRKHLPMVPEENVDDIAHQLQSTWLTRWWVWTWIVLVGATAGLVAQYIHNTYLSSLKPTLGHILYSVAFAVLVTLGQVALAFRT